MEKAFFCNSGAEANEAAIKLARLFGRQKDICAPAIVVMEKSFHGRTLTTLSASGSRKVQAGFEPLVQGFIRAPFDDIDALKQIANSRNDIVAILLEPIQGSGGIRIPHPDYLKAIRQLCDEQNWLLITDEMQCGMGRTGTFLASQQANIKPDIVTLAKGLGNGIPIGACLTRGPANDLFKPGSHGSTFGGNPFSCAVASAVLKVIEKENLLQNASLQGKNFTTALKEQFADHPNITAIRNQGLMIGIEVTQPAHSFVPLALKQGLLVQVTDEKVIRLLPPLILNAQETIHLCEKMAKSLTEFLKKN